jgi:hypothetical protein
MIELLRNRRQSLKRLTGKSTKKASKGEFGIFVKIA